MSLGWSEKSPEKTPEGRWTRDRSREIKCQHDLMIKLASTGTPSGSNYLSTEESDSVPLRLYLNLHLQVDLEV